MGLVQQPLAAIAAISSEQFMALPVSTSTRIAASRALLFFDLGVKPGDDRQALEVAAEC